MPVTTGLRPDTALRAEDVAERGFAFVAGEAMRRALCACGSLSDWDAFAASWADMPLDTHLPDGHRYRRRRHATLSARPGDGHCTVEPHQPHYQAREYNTLVGGSERWFEPVRPEVLGGATFQAVLGLCLRLFGAFRPAAAWHIECHQFRIEARRDAEGLPTPEGVHRDGVDYVLVLLVGRENIESGTTTIHALDGRPLGSFTLSAPLDSALVDDSRVKHGVTAVRPVDPARPAYRDVLVVTFRSK
jgi:hypothetical protein